MRHSIDKNTSVWLDVIRALAAQAVVLGHLHQLFYSGQYSAPNTRFYSNAWNIENALSSVSHQAVIAFFVMSGFLVGNRVLTMIYNQTFNPAVYVLDRLTRLWVVLLPAIAITAIFDRIAMRYGQGWEIISAGTFYPSWFIADQPWSFLHALTNAAFLQMMVGYQYGSNLALWSISNEFWYYMLFPCILIAVFSSGIKRIIGGGCSLAILLLFSIASTQYIPGRTAMLYVYFAVWTVGALLPEIRNRKRIVVGILFIGLACGSGWLNNWRIDPSFKGDWAVAALISGFLLLCSHFPTTWIKRSASFFAGYSYSLYALHLPIILFALSFDSSLKAKVAFTPETFIRFIIYVLAINFGALIFWFMFERRTMQIRNWIRLKIFGGREHLFKNKAFEH